MTSKTISSPATQRKAPSDFTGLQTERLNKEKETERAAAKIAMVDAIEEVSGPAIVDYTDADTPLPEIEVHEVEINNPYRTIRVNSKIENMTFGSQNPLYNFDPGKSYRVPKEMADHLDSKGYLAFIG